MGRYTQDPFLFPVCNLGATSLFSPESRSEQSSNPIWSHKTDWLPEAAVWTEKRFRLSVFVRWEEELRGFKLNSTPSCYLMFITPKHDHVLCVLPVEISCFRPNDTKWSFPSRIQIGKCFSHWNTLPIQIFDAKRFSSRANPLRAPCF